MSSETYFEYFFHAVGQGLFSSGQLHNLTSNQIFNWVFDCGSVSSRQHLLREISHYQIRINPETVDLFCVSHFDEDHINGARQLLSQQRVEVLVMPYFPLIDRLKIAFSSGPVSDEYLQFLVDPVGSMFAAAGDNLGRIVFIRGGGATPGDGVPIPRPNDSPREPFALSIPLDKTEAAGKVAFDDDILPSRAAMPFQVVGHEHSFPVGNEWEFVFFNEHVPLPKSTQIQNAIPKLLQKHRNSRGTFNGDGLLKELKSLYKRVFGSSSVAQNRISLVSYGGPISTMSVRKELCHGGVLPVGYPAFPIGVFVPFFAVGSNQSASIGYFGDFPVDTPKRLRAVSGHFGNQRWQDIALIQVPHHGSLRSWYCGASSQFCHRISVVSSRRGSSNHPSKVVLDDLASRGPVLVNEMQGSYFCGVFK